MVQFEKMNSDLTEANAQIRSLQEKIVNLQQAIENRELDFEISRDPIKA